jgi:hypothetical protein
VWESDLDALPADHDGAADRDSPSDPLRFGQLFEGFI